MDQPGILTLPRGVVPLRQQMNSDKPESIRIGISTCLLGESVRYDGGHKLDRFLTGTLGKYVEYVPVCPEVECGLSVPREAMRLVGKPDSPRLVTQKTGIDYTGQMLGWARRRIAELRKENLCGYIFKSKSPSSGMEHVKVYNAAGAVIGMNGVGIWAREFMRAFPLLPVEDEGRLHDPELRENFIERIFTLNRYRRALNRDNSLKALMAFHASHKFLIMAHSEKHMRKMGRMLAASNRKTDFGALRTRYENALLEALSLPATANRHTDVLEHMAGFLKEFLDGDEKKELGDLIRDFKRELVPLIVPVTLLKHYVRKYKVEYLEIQHYLNPHPLELKLRNHA
jgi:uncharacterized protein YbgA (DUF1722 family)/uncharacterized protein YbbK (DUF523 family)